MRYFLDTEFSENGNNKPIVPISIGIVSEDGREFYEVSNEFKVADCNEFVKINVIPKLGLPDYCWVSSFQISQRLVAFIGEDKNPEFWACWGSYDWVVLCQLFGAMVNLPDHFPYHVHEILQYREQSGLKVSPPRKPKEAHNALADARWNKRYYYKIKKAIDAQGSSK